jgi:hypothetical protein
MLHAVLRVPRDHRLGILLIVHYDRLPIHQALTHDPCRIISQRLGKPERDSPKSHATVTTAVIRNCHGLPRTKKYAVLNRSPKSQKRTVTSLKPAQERRRALLMNCGIGRVDSMPSAR